eukprot:2612657-Pyramimonas_sp.AAC.1
MPGCFRTGGQMFQSAMTIHGSARAARKAVSAFALGLLSSPNLCPGNRCAEIMTTLPFRRCSVSGQEPRKGRPALRKASQLV